MIQLLLLTLVFYGFLQYQAQFIGVNKPMNCIDANNYCKKHYGSTLATIINRHENGEASVICHKLFGSGKNARCYIGLTDMNIRNKYEWRGGIKYNNWRPRYSRFSRHSTNSRRFCIAMKKVGRNFNFHWTDQYDFDTKMPFICDKSNKDLKYSISFPYAVSKKYLTWEKADYFCRASAIGSTLATVRSTKQAKKAGLLCDSVITKPKGWLGCWVGLRRGYNCRNRWQNCKYYWLSGKPWTNFLPFKNVFDYRNNEPCIQLLSSFANARKNHKWSFNDDRCQQWRPTPALCDINKHRMKWAYIYKPNLSFTGGLCYLSRNSIILSDSKTNSTKKLNLDNFSFKNIKNLPVIRKINGQLHIENQQEIYYITDHPIIRNYLSNNKKHNSILSHSCITNDPKNKLLVFIGGQFSNSISSSYTKTFDYNTKKFFKFDNEPLLNIPRSHSGCGYHSYTKKIWIVGGVRKYRFKFSEYLKSVENLAGSDLLTAKKWNYDKNFIIPNNLKNPKLITNTDNSKIYVLGGVNTLGYSKTLYIIHTKLKHVTADSQLSFPPAQYSCALFHNHNIYVIGQKIKSGSYNFYIGKKSKLSHLEPQTNNRIIDPPFSISTPNKKSKKNYRNSYSYLNHKNFNQRKDYKSEKSLTTNKIFWVILSISVLLCLLIFFIGIKCFCKKSKKVAKQNEILPEPPLMNIEMESNNNKLIPQHTNGLIMENNINGINTSVLSPGEVPEQNSLNNYSNPISNLNNY